MDDPPVRLSEITNVELLDFWAKNVLKGVPAAELLSPEDVRRYSKEEPHVMVPTRQARRISRSKVAPEGATMV